MDLVIVLLCLLLGFIFIKSFSNEVAYFHIKTLRRLFLYHILFGLFNYFFFPSDPIRYWALAKETSYTEFLEYVTEKSGTYFMIALDYYPSNVLGLSYFSGTMIYTLIGFIAIALFYIITLKTVPYNSRFYSFNLFPLLFFLPNFHLWSCTAGKDTLSFFSVAIFSYGLLKPLNRFPLIILSIILSYSIRPHIALFLVLAFGLVYVFSHRIAYYQRFIISAVLITIGIFILPSVMDYVKIEETSIEAFNEFSDNKAGLLSRSTTGSRIDITSYPLPLKLFTFLYRPLFFDINGIPALLASIENLFLLLLSIKVLKSNPIEAFRKAPILIKGLVFFLIIGTFAFSNTLGNLGIIIRMRNMFLPGMFIFILWCFSYQRQKRLNQISDVLHTNN